MFSKSTEYALRAVIYIAKFGGIDNKVGLDEISNAIGSPPSFTAKVLQKITKNSKLVGSVTGPKGGFYMTPESKGLSLIEVLNTLDEEQILDKCIIGLDECSEQNPCPLHAQYKHIKPMIIAMFKNKSLQELVDEVSEKKLNLKTL
jgi:Rrf2 family transcriptional regulator, iron-sulfur cluster assembly transcription factor